ncbi:glycosyltransferase family 4 protein [Maricaulis sp.]|uniref:glycosyltransferase family 4 protein n=1 Tax=Maricaulis sp. TaxID=1486257 RepID=UPI0026090FA6|nr:glycosyltransferase family 4 protein [Maricaulis sp.]
MSAPLRPFLFVPRYWPAVGGAELHSRRLAQELALHVPVEVARCCSSEPASTDYAFARARAGQVEDGPVMVKTIAPPNSYRPALGVLGDAAKGSRLARGLYAKLARPAAAASLRQASAQASVLHGVYNGFTPGAEALQSLGKPFVWTPLAHTTKPEGTAWSSPGFRRLYRKADALIAMTEYEREWLIGQGAAPSRVHVAPMAPLFDSDIPDPAAFRTRLGIADAPFVLFLGRTAEYKGYRALLAAAKTVWQSHPDVRFVFSGPLTAEAEAVFAEHTDLRIIVTGPLSGADKKSALSACTVLAVPSTEESLGVVYLEAWSFEKPVIAADIPAMRSVIAHDKDGLLVKPEGSAVAAAIADLLQRPERAQRMGSRGARKVEATYNWAAIADAHLKIYNAIL